MESDNEQIDNEEEDNVKEGRSPPAGLRDGNYPTPTLSLHCLVPPMNFSMVNPGKMLHTHALTCKCMYRLVHINTFACSAYG